MFEDEGKSKKKNGSVNKAKTYLGGWYKTPEEAAETPELRKVLKAIKILRPDLKVTLGSRVGEHEAFNEAGWSILLGLAGMVAEGLITPAELKAKLEEAKVGGK